jgi:predicted NBD/HSP70 family sugar kinase
MEESPLAVGVDIGGTHTKLALVDKGGNIAGFQRMSSASRSYTRAVKR